MSYPSELDTDDIEELAAYIERRYPAEEVRMHDTKLIHFAYWDVFPTVFRRSFSNTSSGRAIACCMPGWQRHRAVAGDAPGRNVENTKIGTKRSATDSRFPVAIATRNTCRTRPEEL